MRNNLLLKEIGFEDPKEVNKVIVKFYEDLLGSKFDQRRNAKTVLREVIKTKVAADWELRLFNLCLLLRLRTPCFLLG